MIPLTVCSQRGCRCMHSKARVGTDAARFLPVLEIKVVVAPLLEHVQRRARVQHARRREQHHGPGLVGVAGLEGGDVVEVKHVLLDKGLFDLLVGPARSGVCAGGA